MLKPGCLYKDNGLTPLENSGFDLVYVIVFDMVEADRK